MYDWLSTVNDKFWLILNYSKVVWDIDTKFSPVVVLMSFQLSTKFEGHNSLKKTAMPLGSSKWKWAWRAHFLSHTLQIWWESLSTLVVKILKFLLWYLKWFPIWQKSVWVFRPYLEESLYSCTTNFWYLHTPLTVIRYVIDIKDIRREEPIKILSSSIWCVVHQSDKT